MTFSIAAWDEITGMTGVAVLTKFFAVGSLCPFAKAGVGAVATQAFVNPTFGPRGLALLEQGIGVEDVVNILLKSDEGREHRQLHMVNSKGDTAAFTGQETVTWAGHRTFPYFSVAGNMLVGKDTILAMAETYQANKDVEFTERLLRALEAGQAAGGDKRGRQSAAIYVVSTEVYAHLDLRVDDHHDPIIEMRRIFEEAKKEYLPFKQFLPTKANPGGVYDRMLIDEIIAKQAANDKHKKI